MVDSFNGILVGKYKYIDLYTWMVDFWMVNLVGIFIICIDMYIPVPWILLECLVETQFFASCFDAAYSFKGRTCEQKNCGNKKKRSVVWLVVLTHLKNISQIGSFPQAGVKIRNIWNHQVVYLLPKEALPHSDVGNQVVGCNMEEKKAPKDTANPAGFR